MDLRQVLTTNLRRLRHQKDLSQEELADAASINRTYVSKLETGATYAGLEILGKLAVVLEVQPYELLLPARKSRRA